MEQQVQSCVHILLKRSSITNVLLVKMLFIFKIMSDPFCRIFQQDNEDVQSDMDLDLLAESESDSETENEGNDARGSGGNVGGNPNDGSDNRNVETAGGGNAANNETFFSDDESGESSHGDEDESEAGETDEQDGDELTFEGGLSGGQFSLLVL